MHLSKQINLWLNWATYAVYGKMREADQIMNQYRSSIHAAARDLMSQRPIYPVELYRGVLVEKNKIVNGKLPKIDMLTFVSFSEDMAVACWFGYPGSKMSAFLLQENPNLAGFIARHTPNREDILFHYSWALELGLIGLAAHHPHVEDPLQFQWNLKTQKEVILKPLDQLEVESIDNFDCGSVEELDEMFTPPHLTL